MGSSIPARHPLRQLFSALTEKTFTEQLGWPDLNVTTYVTNLLVDFTHTDQLFKVKNQQGEQVDTVVDLLFESEVLLEAQSLDRERAVHQYAKDLRTRRSIIFNFTDERGRIPAKSVNRNCVPCILKRSLSIIAAFPSRRAARGVHSCDATRRFD